MPGLDHGLAVSDHNFPQGIPIRFCHQSSYDFADQKRYLSNRDYLFPQYSLAWPDSSYHNQLSSLLKKKEYEIYALKKDTQPLLRLRKKPNDPKAELLHFYARSSENLLKYYLYRENIGILKNKFFTKNEQNFLSNPANFKILNYKKESLKNKSPQEAETFFTERILLNHYRFALNYLEGWNRKHDPGKNLNVYRAYIKAEVYLESPKSRQLILTKAPIQIIPIHENPSCIGQFW